MIPAFIGAASAGDLLSAVRWDAVNTNGTISNGGRTFTGTTSGGSAVAAALKTSGSWYTEAQFVASTVSESIGFMLANQDFTSGGNWLGNAESAPEWGLSVGSNSAYRGLWHNVTRTFPSGFTSATNMYAVGDVVQLAIEMSTGKMWWGVNGTWLNGGAPMATAGVTANMKLAASSFSGQGSFTIMDMLIYPPPSGFLPL